MAPRLRVAEIGSFPVEAGSFCLVLWGALAKFVHPANIGYGAGERRDPLLCAKVGGERQFRPVGESRKEDHRGENDARHVIPGNYEAKILKECLIRKREGGGAR